MTTATATAAGGGGGGGGTHFVFFVPDELGCATARGVDYVDSDDEDDGDGDGSGGGDGGGSGGANFASAALFDLDVRAALSPL